MFRICSKVLQEFSAKKSNETERRLFDLLVRFRNAGAGNLLRSFYTLLATKGWVWGKDLYWERQHETRNQEARQDLDQ